MLSTRLCKLDSSLSGGSTFPKWISTRQQQTKHSISRQDKTRQREVTDAGTTVPLSPHLRCRYSDKQYSLYSTKYSDRSPVPVRLALQSNLTGWLDQNLCKRFLNTSMESTFGGFHGINICTGRGTFGANLGHAIVTNEDFTAYMCDSAATRPSSQITLDRLVLVLQRILNSATSMIVGRPIGLQHAWIAVAGGSRQVHCETLW